MDATTDLAPHSHGTHAPHDHDHGGDHHELGWWRKYVFSTDHKVIGIQYLITGLIFLFFGFMLMMLMRWQLAYPGHVVPGLGSLDLFLRNHPAQPGSTDWFAWLRPLLAPLNDGKMTPEGYNSLGAMHGTIMIFLGIVPVAFAAFGNFVVPLLTVLPPFTGAVIRPSSIR